MHIQPYPQELLKQTQIQLEKCQTVNTKLLIEKSVREKREARQLCVENTLRLGHFTTQLYVCSVISFGGLNVLSILGVLFTP